MTERKMPSQRRLLDAGEIREMEEAFEYFEDVAADDLTTSQIDIITSIQTQFEADHRLSDMQLETIRGILKCLEGSDDEDDW